eukprot:3933577-Alexandrium_andersonii.AAC.1
MGKGNPPIAYPASPPVGEDAVAEALVPGKPRSRKAQAMQNRKPKVAAKPATNNGSVHRATELKRLHSR